MSVQSRRKPSRLLAATVWGLIWAFALCIIGFFVHGTVQEIRNQAVEGFARSYVALYFFSLFVPAVIAFCRTGGVEASKWLYLTVQLLNFTVLLGVFRGVLRLAGMVSPSSSVIRNLELFPSMKRSLFGFFSWSAQLFRCCR